MPGRGIAPDILLTSVERDPHEFTSFARHLDRDWVEEALLTTGTATLRRRRLPSEQVVWLVIGMGLMRDRPIAEVVDDLELALPTAKSSDLAPSSVAQARARVGSEPLEWLFVRTATQWGQASADRDRWRGLALYGVDGTTLRVPDSDENRRHFGTHPSGKGRGDSGYPQIRLVVLMALRSHVLAAASFGPYGDEHRYASDLWPSVPDDSLLIVDRNFLAANILMPLEARGQRRHWLTRAKSTTKWRVIRPSNTSVRDTSHTCC